MNLMVKMNSVDLHIPIQFVLYSITLRPDCMPILFSCEWLNIDYYLAGKFIFSLILIKLWIFPRCLISSSLPNV